MSTKSSTSTRKSASFHSSCWSCILIVSVVISAPIIVGLVTVLTVTSLNQSIHITQQQQQSVSSATSSTISTTTAMAVPPTTSSTSSVVEKNTPSSPPTTKIPPHLHLIYVSQGLSAKKSLGTEISASDASIIINQTIPNSILKRVRTWQINHPHWNVTLWNDQLVHETYPHLIPILSQLTQEAWSSDVLRYYILKDFGGIYLDSDITPLRRLDPLLSLDGSRTTTATAFGLCEDPIRAPAAAVQGSNPFIQDPKIKCNSFANGIIGSIPNHPALIDIANLSWKNTVEHVNRYKKNLHRHNRKYYVNTSTILEKVGPRVWTPIALQYNLTILRGYTFIPCEVYYIKHNLCNISLLRKDPVVLGMHGYATSWRNHGWSKVPI